MKNYKNLLCKAMLTNVIMVFSVFGMDMGQSTLEQWNPSKQSPTKQPLSLFNPSDLQQSLYMPQSNSYAEAYQLQSEDLFIAFHPTINRLLSDDRENVGNALEKSKDILKELIGESNSLLQQAPFNSFLKDSHPNADLIKSVKKAFNDYFFKTNPNYLCKSVPYFLEQANKENPRSIEDVEDILERLSEKSNADIWALNNIKKDFKLDIQKAQYLNQNTIEKYLNSLDQMCNFFPKRSFDRAVNELIEYQLTALLRYNELPEPSETIQRISDNINVLISYISIQKNAQNGTRISKLKQIQQDIKSNKTFTSEQIKTWKQDIEDIVAVTRNPNVMMSSTLQLQEINEQRKQQENSYNAIFNNTDALISNPKILLDYMINKGWNKETQIYALQLLFWYAHKDKSTSSQIDIIRELKKLNANAPGINHQRGTLPSPIFTYSIDSLPKDAPASLQQLFEQIKKEESGIEINNFKNAIETLLKDIANQKKLLQNPSNIQEMAQKSAKFYREYRPTNKTPQEIEDITRADFKQTSDEEIQKLIAQNMEFAQKRAKEITPILERAPLNEKRIRDILESSIKDKEKSVRRLLTQLIQYQDESISELDAIKKTINKTILENFDKRTANDKDILFSNPDNYTNFPDDLSLTYAFEMLKYLHKSDLKNKTVFINQLSTIIKQSIDDKKINENEQQIKELIQRINKERNDEINLFIDQEMLRKEQEEAHEKRIQEMEAQARHAAEVPVQVQTKRKEIEKFIEEKKEERRSEIAQAGEKEEARRAAEQIQPSSSYEYFTLPFSILGEGIANIITTITNTVTTFFNWLSSWFR